MTYEEAINAAGAAFAKALRNLDRRRAEEAANAASVTSEVTTDATADLAA
jgi:hypothetical protein